jgi:hypothetical protein
MHEFQELDFQKFHLLVPLRPFWSRVYTARETKILED